MYTTSSFPSVMGQKFFKLTLISLLFGGVSVAQAEDQPKVYPKQPMAAFSSQADDALLGNKYEKPVWNLHDTLHLPDWLAASVNQRTRYESLTGAFKAKTMGGDQQIALQTDLWLQAQLGAFRFATEIMDSREVGADAGSGVNNTMVNTADFVQGYVSWVDKDLFGSHIGTEIKAGRQLMTLGSARLVSNPYYRNTPNTFTGARLRFLDGTQWQFNGFVTMPVVRFPSAANDILTDSHRFDQEATHTVFSGAFFEKSNVAFGVSGEVYMYNLNEADSWNNATHKRQYYTPGMRFYMKPAKGKFDFQTETMGQFGTVRYLTTSTQDQMHQAWAEHADLGYTIDMPWSPRLMLEYDYASGSKNPGSAAGSTDQRFDPLYGVTVGDFGATGIYGAIPRSNINSPGYKLNLAPRSDLQFTLQQRFVWLASASDCWGQAACSPTPILQPTKSSGSYVGDQVGVTGRYDYNSSLNFDAGWFYLFKGQFAKQGAATVNATTTVPSLDSQYFYLQSQLRF
ncbi:MAG: alginate export family protein [Methylococcales bacterium]